MSDLTRQEAQRLMWGFELWNEHVKGGSEGDDGPKPGKEATAGDHEAFEEFAADVNSPDGGEDEPTPPHLQ